MNRLKKLTSAFDKQKLANYKALLKQQNAQNNQNAAPATELPEGEPRPKKYYVTGGPQLYISTLLNKRGALTTKQMWFEYTRDSEAVEKNLLPSLTYLKTKIVPSMVEMGKLEKTGFSKVKSRFFGYKLNPIKAFKNVHPDVMATIEPKVDINQRPAAPMEVKEVVQSEVKQ